MQAEVTANADLSDLWAGPSIVGLTHVFADQDVERRYQSAMAVHSRRRLLALMGIAVCVPIVSLVALLFGLPEGPLTRGAVLFSCIEAALGLGFGAAVWRSQTAASLEGLSLAFGLITIILRCAELSWLPQDGGSSVLLGWLVLLYFGLPIRLVILAPMMAMGSGAMLAAWFAADPPPHAYVPLLESVWVLNLLGATSMRTMRYTLRRQWSQSQALRHMATHDGLTGVANRQFYDRALANEWRRCVRARAKLSVVVVDIDLFKSLNDDIGHAAGDSCLRDMAAVLESCALRPTDMLARTGGEEFAFLLPETDERGALVLAQRVRHAVQEAAIAHPCSPIGPFITVSLGVATAQPYTGFSPWELTALADSLLYAAKRDGRNCLRQQVLGQVPALVDVPGRVAENIPSGD